jgi:hypothetical protein
MEGTGVTTHLKSAPPQSTWPLSNSISIPSYLLPTPATWPWTSRTFIWIHRSPDMNTWEPLFDYRVRLAYGGDRSDYPFEVSTTTVDVTTVKLHFNSIISTPNARHMTMDLQNFYLNTPLTRYEYTRAPLSMIPQSVIEHYNLLEIATDGFVMVEIVKGIYGLPQAGILAKALLDVGSLSFLVELCCYGNVSLHMRYADSHYHFSTFHSIPSAVRSSFCCITCVLNSGTCC